jgi:hypothetical protein
MTIVLKAVAKWRITVINIPSSGTLPKRALPNSICPLLLTGKNSVNPWIMPRRIASSKSMNISY